MIIAFSEHEKPIVAVTYPGLRRKIWGIKGMLDYSFPSNLIINSLYLYVITKKQMKDLNINYMSVSIKLL